jgi:hypothetical protein
MKYTFTNSSYVVLHWKSWMKLISLIHFVCGPALGNHGWISSIQSNPIHSWYGTALEILDEVHQSNRLQMWYWTGNLRWNSSVQPTSYVDLNWKYWMKFISWITPNLVLHWIC